MSEIASFAAAPRGRGRPSGISQDLIIKALVARGLLQHGLTMSQIAALDGVAEETIRVRLKRYDEHLAGANVVRLNPPKNRKPRKVSRGRILCAVWDKKHAMPLAEMPLLDREVWSNLVVTIRDHAPDGVELRLGPDKLFRSLDVLALNNDCATADLRRLIDAGLLTDLGDGIAMPLDPAFRPKPRPVCDDPTVVAFPSRLPLSEAGLDPSDGGCGSFDPAPISAENSRIKFGSEAGSEPDFPLGQGLAHPTGTGTGTFEEFQSDKSSSSSSSATSRAPEDPNLIPAFDPNFNPPDPNLIPPVSAPAGVIEVAVPMVGSPELVELATACLKAARNPKSTSVADQQAVRSWLKQGIDRATMIAVIAEKMAKPTDRVRQLEYFHRPMAEAAARQAATPPPKPAESAAPAGCEGQKAPELSLWFSVYQLKQQDSRFVDYLADTKIPGDPALQTRWLDRLRAWGSAGFHDDAPPTWSAFLQAERGAAATGAA